MPSKLQKFEEFNQFANCFFLPFEKTKEGFGLRGKWNSNYFLNTNSIVLELGCGRGEYTVGLARKNKNNNYIGVDIKGNRIWTGAKQAIEEELTNVAFLRTRIDFIASCFDENEVDEIWITFPDPQPNKPRERKRLTHPLFLNRYYRFLKPGGTIHLKTDNTGFYEYTLSVIEDNELRLVCNTPDLYKYNPSGNEELTDIQTYYEKLFSEKGERIKYLSFANDENKKL